MMMICTTRLGGRRRSTGTGIASQRRCRSMSPRRRRNRGVGREVILVIPVIREVVRGVIRGVIQEVIREVIQEVTQGVLGAIQEATPDVVRENTQEATPDVVRENTLEATPDAIQGNTPEAGHVTTLVPKEAAVTVTGSLSCNKHSNSDHA